MSDPPVNNLDYDSAANRCKRMKSRRQARPDSFMPWGWALR